MKPKKISVSGLFEMNVQYKIPLFQRYYVWGKDAQWELLWDDIVRQHNSHTQEKSSAHFTGAIVMQQQNTLAGDFPQYDIIDGQQRLTTFQIILCAIRDICVENNHTEMASDVRHYIQNQGKKGEVLKGDARYKLIPTKRDRDSFISLVNDRVDQCRGIIDETYSYFYDQIREYVDMDKEKIHSLFLCIKDHFRFVLIPIDETDRPEKIFESLNARGKKLFEFDLLRNNLFLRAREDRDSLYEKSWQHFEDPYWAREVTKDETFSDIFLQHFLMAKLRTESVKPEFLTYERKYLPELKQRGDTTIEDEFSDLKRYSEVYQQITDCENDSQLENRMRFYQTFNLTTLHPFVLYLTCEVGLKGRQLDRVLHILESYTIRRMLCYRGKGGLKNFNKFFASLIKRLGDNFSLGSFIEYLSQETSRTNKYPTDSEIRSTLHTRFERNPLPFPDSTTLVFPGDRLVRAALEGLWAETAGAIKQRLIRYILYRIELRKMKEDKFAEPLSFEDNLTTLEHIMPKEWMKTWSLPVGEGSVKYDTETRRVSVNRAVGCKDMLYDDLFSDRARVINAREGLADKSYEDVYNLAVARDSSLESIGNLTLVTRELNSKLGNRTFAAKKEALGKHSLLKLNAEICEEDVWDVNEIHGRAEGLIADFCEIWPSLDWFGGE
ncbi:MAG: DUF262 domain-containing HNH endonuclease family protein [Candidatus Poribacteria bacterium]|nr:DUF262 domain-containing HNH endonuclease family protein [Candidatus Poribacteria bacterium]